MRTVDLSNMIIVAWIYTLGYDADLRGGPSKEPNDCECSDSWLPTWCGCLRPAHKNGSEIAASEMKAQVVAVAAILAWLAAIVFVRDFGPSCESGMTGTRIGHVLAGGCP